MQSRNKVMQRWSADAIEFMRDASEFSSFNQNLLSEIRGYLPENGHVCDAGCGLGYLSAQLATVCRKVTAVDLSEDTTAFARKHHNADNLRFFCTDIHTLSECFDAMVFCYFGRTKEILDISKKLCCGNIIIVKRDCFEHRFSINEVARKHAVDNTAEYLQQSGIPFVQKKLSLELGQPFRSLDDAVRFFRQYDKSGAEITTDMVFPRLEKMEHTDYKYYLPEKRAMEIIVFQASDIPKDVGEK